MRVSAATLIATVATPLLRPTAIVRQCLAMRVETAREIVTYHLLETLTCHGVEFDPTRGDASY